VPTQWVTIAEAAEAIIAAGGVAVIAHPHAYQLSNKWLRRLLCEAKVVGVTGVEVAISVQPPGERAALATFAKEIGLAASVGSDFHYQLMLLNQLVLIFIILCVGVILAKIFVYLTTVCEYGQCGNWFTKY